MSIDAFLKFEGIDGESSREGHENEIDVLSWGWGATNVVARSAGGGSGVGQASAGDFSFVHHYDKASPTLAKALATGRPVATVTLTSRKAGDGQQDFLKVTFKAVNITSISPSGASGGDITETVSFFYEDIEFEYKPQDAKGGLGGAVKFGWNIKTGAKR
ncbi:type VI secretion system tube protein Hcp [Pigmentiphaga soli]|uniref:Type VI secretion system tube protein Hcp n=1 Tax=Pigmentiphaga soli TaxID=1007095 RepID=A0ABP8HP48_9BURK